MFRPITYAPRGRMSHSFATLSASLARGSPMCQPCSSSPRLPRGFSRLWSGPATKPSSEIDMWQVVSGIANLQSDSDLHAGEGIMGIVAGDGILDHRLRRLVAGGLLTRARGPSCWLPGIQ